MGGLFGMGSQQLAVASLVADDRIELGRDPWSQEYWSKLQPLVDAMYALRDGNLLPYAEYWLRRADSIDTTKAMQMAKAYQAVLQGIENQGYLPDAWQARSDSNLDLGFGPISVAIGADGTIWLRDGSHRASILRVLGRPVTPWVWKRDPRWLELKDANSKLYSPYPHPDFANHPVQRRNTNRFTAIAEQLADLHCTDVLFVGACTGAGPVALAEVNFTVTAIEPADDRYTLLESWFNRVGLAGRCDKLRLTDYRKYGNHHAIIGMSIYQHAAQSIAKWQQCANLLADCPVHVLELPGNHERQWHQTFRQESDGKPRDMLLRMLSETGAYRYFHSFYQDSTYANRETMVIAR